MLFYRNTDAQQQFTGARLRRIAVHLAVFNFKIGNFVAVFFAHFRQRIDTVTFLLHFPQFSVTHNNGVQNGELFKSELILTQFTDAFVRIE
ncbi:hypothetical protein D3C81_2169150 [compost metagenome]